eukprot:TRINITY_DN1776_c0_g1_i1.p1 TRINITY_DN1776_c0_g1~~TRINITY_DN1776_c0_g1_i1.p1  ORF type:complete len:173 (+),score=54.12 TRINITY_DN1776_c0_g1_i1:78-596(+)
MSAWKKVSGSTSFHDATPAVAMLVKSICDRADATPEAAECDPKLAVFDGAHAVAVSINRYLVRLTKYAGIAPSTFVTTFILLDRFASRTTLNRRNSHRAVAGAFIVAAMLSEDAIFSYGHYAGVCGMRVEEVSAVSKAFLRVIDFDLAIPAALYRRIESELLTLAERMPKAE